MKTQWERDTTELADICHRLKHARDLDLDTVQELYYRKNYLESSLALEDPSDEFGDE